MTNLNRLIDDFKRQTKSTIWKHMDAMAVNYAVYSNRIKGFDPFICDNDIYIYANGSNIVVVCIDCCGHGEDQVYEESEGIDMLIFQPGTKPRESSVWKLKETMQIMNTRLENANMSSTIFGVLITEATITNADWVEDVWEKNNIKVIDGFKTLKHRRAEVNPDVNTSGAVYFDTVTASCLDFKIKPKCDEVDDDEFLKALKAFSNGDFDVVKESQDDDELPQDEEEEKEESASPPTTSGTIDQNLGLSVEVEILNPIDNPREELNKLIGCYDIKRRMDELVALTTYNKTMQKFFPDSKQHEVSLHSVFLGRPGTGKTTVCKIFGSLLHQAGALSKGHVVVCDRGTFIGTLWGDEERSVRQVLEKAKGGVLMIDEAYLLNSKNENDPGRLVIQLLMSILADETQRDIAVVLCGYKDQMLKLLETNPGLQSRFPNRFEFQDFSVNELLEITQTRVKHYEYQFTDQAWVKYRTMLNQAYQVRDPQTWGNARFVANQLDRIYIQHATRCVKQRPKDKQSWRMITPEDIVPIEIPRQKTKIGF